MSLFAAELLLSYQRRQIERSDHMSKGMVAFDAELGWRLTPRWLGSHRHHDFEVSYAINRYGFRGEFPEPRTGKRYALIGDSFTFGIGVEDNQTFVHLLNSAEQRSDTFLNFSVPGTSTDQQYLLIKRRLAAFAPDVIVLMVYLANDLFDNQLAFPLQAEHPKPFFQLTNDGRLRLMNSPVPRTRKPAAAKNRTLSSVVLGEQIQAGEPSFQAFAKLELFRRLGFFQNIQQITDGEFEQRFASALELFEALVSAIQLVTAQQGAELKIVLLAGKSFIDQPDSVSGQYQDFLRRRIVTILENNSAIQLLDMAAQMRTVHAIEKANWYFPNEGHLNPEGHRLLAKLLAERL